MKFEDTFITVISTVPTVCVLSASPAMAAPASELPAQTRIVGGELTKTCHWPSAAYLSGGCTATLVHPEIVTTAKHCISSSSKTVSFGETGDQNKLAVKATCKSWSGQGDMGYCKLSKPVTTVPIVPILMGCELEALEQKGLDVALVGFGRTSGKSKDYGTKREVFTPLQDGPGAGGGNVKEAEILVGHETKGACNGDSGGPAYIDLRTVPGLKDKPGAGWRVFGVTSRPGPGAKVCLGTTVYGMIHKMVDWIEKDSGIDVTPCFDADGTWNPGPDCKPFPDPQAGGSWDSCEAGKDLQYSHVCGEHPDDPGSGEEKSGEEGSGESESGGEESGGEESDDDPKSEDGSGEDPGASEQSPKDPTPKTPEASPTPEGSEAESPEPSDSSPTPDSSKPEDDEPKKDPGGCKLPGPKPSLFWLAAGWVILGRSRVRKRPAKAAERAECADR